MMVILMIMFSLNSVSVLSRQWCAEGCNGYIDIDGDDEDDVDDDDDDVDDDDDDDDDRVDYL